MLLVDLVLHYTLKDAEEGNSQFFVFAWRVQ